MKSFRFLVIFFSVIFSFTVQATGLTTESAREMLTAMDLAVENGNVDTFSRYISEDTVFYFGTNNKNGPHTIKMNKEELLSSIYQSYIRADSYEIARDNIRIEIKSPSKAQITSRLVEKITMHGKQFSGTTRDKLTIEQIEGDLLITAYSSSTRM